MVRASICGSSALNGYARGSALNGPPAVAGGGAAWAKTIRGASAAAATPPAVRTRLRRVMDGMGRPPGCLPSRYGGTVQWFQRRAAGVELLSTVGRDTAFDAGRHVAGHARKKPRSHAPGPLADSNASAYLDWFSGTQRSWVLSRLNPGAFFKVSLSVFMTRYHF